MGELRNNGRLSCEKLLEAYRGKGSKTGEAVKLAFGGVDGRDVYNISAPFDDEGEQVIAGRVESRDSEESEIRFFVRREEQWVPREGAPVFVLQDPFYTRIGGELVLGGVQTFPHPVHEGALSWRTVFYKGPSLNRLDPFFQGPDQMKDLRLVELPGGAIGVFTRPQGEKGGRGKIGFAKVARLEDLSVEAVMEAPLLEQFLDEEWGGCNEIHLLKSGKLGVLGHIARFDGQGDRHYYPMAFGYDPATGEYSDMEIIAERADFLPGPSKRPDLADVVFSGGLVRQSGGKAELYAGISDAEAQRLVIDDPFAAMEK
ncbi:MTP-1 family protein [Paenibacillus macerans]|uniref:MTP-1 family protein n=1 Tax=Paenibacillus macerans TaxID=44252 RepID=UPI003D31A78D